MTNFKQFVFLVVVALIALFAVANVTAAGAITELEVNGIETVGTAVNVGGFYDQTVPVRVQFMSDALEEETRIKAWFSGSGVNSASTERFDVLPNTVYSRSLQVQLPNDFDDRATEEPFVLNILIESRASGEVASAKVDVYVQRESFLVEILDVDMPLQVSAGEILPIDVVIKNRGRQFADDSFVEVRVPQLGIGDRAYFGDLSPVDQGGNVAEEEDAAERRLFLRIPDNVSPGIYTVEVSAFNSDSLARVQRQISVVGVSQDTIVVAPVHSRSFGVGETGEYSLTLVNSGNKVRVFELIVDAPSSLDVAVSEPVVAVPAGTSRTVSIDAIADEEGKHTFVVNVHTNGGELVKTETFTASVEGKGVAAGNLTVLLTVILAIIFVVLLVVLIVLLTRKPEQREELGESYY